jgi:L-lysine exporter family protein LysE/ArgO
VSEAIIGFFTGLTLIIAIGAQNAFVLRLGLARNHVGIAVVVCAVSDVLLIVLGISGLGALFRSLPTALVVMRWVGVIYLLWYAFRSFRSALRPQALIAGEQEPLSRRSVLLMVLGFTFLNPHVYLDTVLLLGSIGNQYEPNEWWFALGASIASVTWFVTLGFGARIAAPLMSRPVTWRILDIGIGLVMVAIALRLATLDVV